MTLSVLMDTKKVVEWILNGRIGEINDIIDHICKFDNEFMMDEENASEMYDAIYQKRKLDETNRFSIWLDRGKRRNSKISIEQSLYEELKKCLDDLSAVEAKDIKNILYNDANFNSSIFIMGFGYKDHLRWIKAEDDFIKIMTLFGTTINDLHEFTEYIKVVYNKIYFDVGVEQSMRKLNEKFIARRHEILYHLYCIQKEVPDIIGEYGITDNKSIGEKMSIKCSPERKREIVEKKLTKSVDNGKKINCELHTKMETHGSNIPDRIYFCACVPHDRYIDGERIDGRIYVYKITEHA